jgi:predicted alpha/beta-hydrolase family hydrolase
MAARRSEGKRGAPDRQPVLLDHWRKVVAELGGGAALVIGGKSMGGRIASMVADELAVRGLICFGYPFHPPGQPDRPRTEHLETLKTPTLIIQGERDAFGKPDEVATYRLSRKIRIEWLQGGDHSFKPPAKSGLTERENVERAIDMAARFIDGRG